MFDFLRAKDRMARLVQFLTIFLLVVSASNAFALGSSLPESDERNESSGIIESGIIEKGSVNADGFCDSHGIDYDTNKLLKWREQIQEMINESKISDVGETIMDSLEECVASINIRLGLLELGEKHVRD